MNPFSWKEHNRLTDELRAMGCAVCTITPADIQVLTEDEDGNETLSDAAADEWMSLHSLDVEEAIMGDYWAESVRAVLDQYPVTTDKRAALERWGFIVGERTLQVNTDYPGRFMVVEPHEPDELPTRDGSNGPWAVVGDNLDELIETAFDFGADTYGRQENQRA